MLKFLYAVLAIVSLINGAWMLISPHSWYFDLPAAVPDTGPYNAHFIRDLGLVFLLISLGFVWCAMDQTRSRWILVAITVFFTGHAILHILDLLTHRLPHTHWRIDFPAVFLPALLLLLLTSVEFRRSRRF